MNIKDTVLAIGDIHYPYHNKKTFEIACKIANDIKPTKLIFGGDNWDANGISPRFSKRSPENGIAETLEQMHDFRNNYFLPLQKACRNKNLKTYLMLGNHEGQRLSDKFDYLAEIQELSALRHWQREFDFKTIFNCEIIPYNNILRIGKLGYTHGFYTNEFHTKKNIHAYLCNISNWHLHTVQIYTQITALNEPFQARSLPCACDLNPKYKKNAPNGWVNGLAVDYILDNGHFFPNIIQIISGKTIFNGRVYE